MARTLVTNVSGAPITLPAPYGTVMKPGAAEVLPDTNANVVALLGGDAAIAGVFRVGYLSDDAVATLTPAPASAPLDSPVFTTNPRGPTPAPGDNDTSLATTAFVTAAVAAALASAGGGAEVRATIDGMTAPGTPTVTGTGVVGVVFESTGIYVLQLTTAIHLLPGVGCQGAVAMSLYNDGDTIANVASQVRWSYVDDTHIRIQFTGTTAKNGRCGITITRY